MSVLNLTCEPPYSIVRVIWSALYPKNGLARTTFSPPAALPTRPAASPPSPYHCLSLLSTVPVPRLRRHGRRLDPCIRFQHFGSSLVTTEAPVSSMTPSTSAADMPLASPTVDYHHLGQHRVHVAVKEPNIQVAKPMTSCENAGLPPPVPKGRRIRWGN